jgi:hypothetical protein
MPVISAGAAQKLGLVSVDVRGVTGIVGTVLTNRYNIALTLPNNPKIRVAEWDGGRNYDMLIGMDIISQGNFYLQNSGGKTVFTFRA